MKFAHQCTNHERNSQQLNVAMCRQAKEAQHKCYNYKYLYRIINGQAFKNMEHMSLVLKIIFSPLCFALSPNV